MKIEWIEDFLELIDAGTFSLAAERRHVTQPAFSRRIRQLEEWLGAELIDRESNRLELTPHARQYEPQLREWLARLYALRNRMRSEAHRGPRAIFTTQHTLTVSYLPRLLRHVRSYAPDVGLQIRSSDRSDCIIDFERGRADLLLCSELEGQPLFSQRQEIQRTGLGIELLLPVCAADRMGKPIHALEPHGRLPLIAYDPESFLGGAIATPFLLDLQRHYDVEVVCETSFTVGIRQLALAGLGVAWLPHGLIEQDLETGKLVSLLEGLGGPRLEVACYRNGCQTSESVELLWHLLTTRAPEV